MAEIPVLPLITGKPESTVHNHLFNLIEELSNLWRLLNVAETELEPSSNSSIAVVQP